MNNKIKGILCIISSAFCFALMNTFVKLSGDIPSMQKSFFRNLVALIFALIILIRSEQKFSFKKENLIFLILRSAFGTIGILCNYYAVDRLILSDASMLGKMSPFLVIVFSAVFLAEKANIIQVMSVIIAFLGSLLIIKPGFSINTFPAVVGFMGAVGAAAAYTTVRFLSKRGERGAFIVFFFSAFSCLVTLPYLIFKFTPMTMTQLAFLMLAGLAASGGQFSVTAAYSYCPAKEISVYDYSQVIFAAIMGFFIFGDLPDILSILGYIIILCVSVIMFIYNNKPKKEL